jgi:hypothetical protein
MRHLSHIRDNGASIERAAVTATVPTPAERLPFSFRGLRVRNLCPANVSVQGHEHEFVLPPLGEKELDRDEALRFDRAKLEMCGRLEVDLETEGFTVYVLGALVWAFLLGGIGIAAAWLIGGGRWALFALLTLVTLVIGVLLILRASTSAWQWVREKLAMIFVLLVGFGLPAAVLLFGTGLFDLLREDMGAALDPRINQIVAYRGLQVMFLGIAATFPAMLYFLFDGQQVETLRTRFLLAVFRLDRSIDTMQDWKARYGRQVTEAYGKPRAGRARLLGGRRSPVVLASEVLTIGWVLAFLNLDAVRMENDQVLAGGSLLGLFEPERGVVAFGFLGAYFFGVNTVLRSYLRGDLRPKAYSQITSRVLIVVVLTSVVALTPLGDEPTVLAIAFVAGIVPDTILQWIWERLPLNEGAGDPLVERQPLSTLEGIDIYDRTRLSEEGVTNVQSLAHCDLIELLLQTRIPPARLVDWVDQAILRLHLPPAAPTREGDNATSTGSGLACDALRSAGIRTATDLLTLSGAQVTNGRVTWANAPFKPTSEDAIDLAAAMGVAADDDDRPMVDRSLSVLCQVISDEEWVVELLAWRAKESRELVVIDCASPSTERTFAEVMATLATSDGAHQPAMAAPAPPMGETRVAVGLS